MNARTKIFVNPLKVYQWGSHLLLGVMFFSLTACSGDSPVVEDEEPVPSEETKDPEPNTPKDPEPTVNVNVGRGLVASINGNKNASYFPDYNNKVLVSWRMFPTDDKTTGFDLYRKSTEGDYVKLNSEPITSSTNFQDTEADRSVDNTYRLCAAGSTIPLDTYTLTASQASAGLPYVSIPLKSALDVVDGYDFRANDASIGDVDGDGKYEIILKRLATKLGTTTEEEDNLENDDETGTSATAELGPYHTTLLEAYRTNGTFLWRVKLGPNIIGGNSTSMAVADFDGDGRAEVAVRTGEGAVFADGTEIGDTNNDGKTDYRVAGANYVPACPTFLSVIEGSTGKELARGNYIEPGQSTDWGDNYWKRASSIRVGVAHFSSSYPSIVACRGVYGKSVIEGWDYRNGKLSKRWRFNTASPGYSSWAGQGNHSLCTGDVDGDGCDEVVYGGICIDHNGKGLWNSGQGHGDAMHLGKFDPSRDGLQIWSCFESGDVAAALRDAKTGETIWDYKKSGDMGRCAVADIDPDSPGCEMWWYQGNAHSPKGDDLGYSGMSTNMAIWFDGTLNRQLYDRSTINAPRNSKGRVFTVYRYEVTTINSTKSNPNFYGDIWGDWREELIQVTSDFSELRIFTTWYPTEYKFPYLMSDHVYAMSALNQNIGYNMPTETGYYLGSDLLKDK